MLFKISYTWIKVAVGLTLLGLLFVFVDLEKVFISLKQLQVKWLFATVVCILCATFLGAFNAFLLMSRKGEIKWSLFIPIYWIAWAFSLITPGQIGDIATITSLLKKQQIDWHLSFGRSLLDKLISFVVMIVLATIGLYFASIKYINYEKFEIFFLWLIPLVGIFLIFFYLKFSSIFPLSHSGIRGLIGRMFQEAKLTIHQHPARIIINIVLTCIKILLIGASYWCIFRGMGVENIDLMKTITLAAASSLIAYIPISFNGLGTVEASGLVLFSQLGVSTNEILATYLCLRIVVMILAWIPSAVILLFWRNKSTE